MASLLEEFQIHPLGTPIFTIAGYPIAFTNSALFMFFAVMASTMLMTLAMRPQAIVPGRWQMTAESIYNMVADMVDGAAGEKAKPFFPFIFSIFVFILFCNLFGMVPSSLAVTSHIIINLSIALFLFLIITIAGFINHGLHFLHIFVPKGAPKALLPFLVVIEILSFIVRPFSLSIRLFANMLAGHILLQVFAGMSLSLFAAAWVFKPLFILPLVANIGITGFEFFVAVVQAYVYAFLSAIYLRDAIEMH